MSIFFISHAEALVYYHCITLRQFNFCMRQSSFRIALLSINRDISLLHFDEVFKYGGLRSFKYGGDFEITQPVLPTFERNSHIVRQI